MFLVHLAQFFNTINQALFISEPFSIRTAIYQDTFSFLTACILKLNKLDKLEGGSKNNEQNVMYKHFMYASLYRLQLREKKDCYMTEGAFIYKNM